MERLEGGFDVVRSVEHSRRTRFGNQRQASDVGLDHSGGVDVDRGLVLSLAACLADGGPGIDVSKDIIEFMRKNRKKEPDKGRLCVESCVSQGDG